MGRDQAERQAARVRGRHRRPRRLAVWGRSVRTALRRPLVAAAAGTTATMSRLVRSTRRAQVAALSAEVIALRVTVAEMRDAVARAEARAESLAAELAVTRELAAAPVQGPAAMPPAGPPATLELPLVRLALARSAGRSLTREMAAALASPDRSQDTARTEIVLADLPERGLLDPVTDRTADPVDPAAASDGQPAVVPADQGARRIA